ncbi:MAG: putative manganese-dependent inorganic diphosphatase [Clostridia bacterium]|nr:putative manganese-dependent inorganic diphosphatase [Clostridia bacterium]
MKQTTYIFGHRKPDTDSVASAIALSYLKNKRGHKTMPVVLDDINKETQFVLDYFGIKQPEFLNDVKLKIEDVNYYKDCYVSEKESIKKTYEYIKEKNITGVPIVDLNRKLLGLVTVKMIGNELISGDFTHLKTSYDNILDTLKGKEILKVRDEINGEILTAAFRSATILNSIEMNENNIVIVGDRHSIIEYAIQSKVQLLVIVGGEQVKEEHLELAKKNKVNIISTQYDTFHTAKLIGLSGYVSTLLHNARIEKINEKDYLDSFVELSSKQGYNNYPVVNKKGKCVGLIRVTDIKEKNRKKVILVDHNEAAQSVVGLEEAEITEIVDHHKIGDLTTNKPINFRNMKVGSTNTIIYMLYTEAGIKVPKDIAGIMLSGIISDTLKFTSPTTTEMDKNVAHILARIAEVDIDEYALKMFKAGTKLDGRTTEEIILSDMKIFPIDEEKIAVSQVFTLNSEEILAKKQDYIKVLDSLSESKGYSIAILCLTDIIKNGSYILYNKKYEEQVKEALELGEIYQGIYVEGVLSRKKQIVPKLMRHIKK